MSIQKQGRPFDPEWNGPGLPPGWQPPQIELRILGRPWPGRRDRRTWIGGIVVVFILSCFASPWLQQGPATAVRLPLGVRPAAEVPPTLRPYHARALAGDAGAMRLLAGMYYYGLNGPQDLEEGARWYRRAAAAGSAEAAREMEQLGLSRAD